MKPGIRAYWQEYERDLPQDEVVDEITWNDLEMDRIFWRMNTNCSFAGEQELFKTLHHIPKNKDNLDALEEQIQYFTEHDDERERIQMELFQLGKEENCYAIPAFVSGIGEQKVRYVWLFRLMQLVLLGSVLLLCITRANQAWILLGLVAMVNLVLYAVEKGRYEIYLDTLGGIIRIVRLSKKLVKDKTTVISGGKSIREHVSKLEKLTHMVAALQNKKRASMSGDVMGLLQDYLFGITLWDFIQFDKVIHILQNQEACFMELYAHVGRMDMAIAIASFRQSLEMYCLPEFVSPLCPVSSDTSNILYAEGLYHPLVEGAVGNTVRFSGDCLITGSNASGKSTFIKAVAVNVILAESIHTCTAGAFSLPDTRILTSMAVRDDMMKGESYFIKEVKYLKRIVDAADADRFLICVVDEILRGTNTKERIAASFAVLDYLADRNCLAIVASHDVELADLLGEAYERYYFCEKMTDDGITFDYKIHEGVNDSRNAIRLLEYMGFPGEIIRQARRYGSR